MSLVPLKCPVLASNLSALVSSCLSYEWLDDDLINGSALDVFNMHPVHKKIPIAGHKHRWPCITIGVIPKGSADYYTVASIDIVPIL